MARFTYSPTGALKWKKDVAEYSEALRAYGVAAVDEAMASLEQARAGRGEGRAGWPWGCCSKWGRAGFGRVALARLGSCRQGAERGKRVQASSCLQARSHAPPAATPYPPPTRPRFNPPPPNPPKGGERAGGGAREPHGPGQRQPAHGAQVGAGRGTPASPTERTGACGGGIPPSPPPETEPSPNPNPPSAPHLPKKLTPRPQPSRNTPYPPKATCNNEQSTPPSPHQTQQSVCQGRAAHHKPPGGLQNGARGRPHAGAALHGRGRGRHVAARVARAAASAAAS